MLLNKKLLIGACILLSAAPALAKVYNFPINPPRNLNFKTYKEIFRIRKKMIAENPIFFQGKYDPLASSVFKQIEEGKPWWGLRGLMCYGPGKLAIEGESDESRFIDNPFLLISMEEGFALTLMKDKGNCPLSYPKPIKISFDSDKRIFHVTYSVSGHERTIAKTASNNRTNSPKMTYSFNGRNAIDFAVPYVYATKPKNLHFVDTNNISKSVYQFKDFIHVGGSCGYSGGCNNGSPRQKETEFQIDKYPASITFKLWKRKPTSPDEKADLSYEIKIN